LDAASRPAEEARDSANAPLTQLRLEHDKWPITLRVEGRATDKPMADVLAEEEKATVLRGMLYQVFQTGSVDASGRTWQYRIGSITYPDRRRGWISALFIHAATPAGTVLSATRPATTQTAEAKRWLTVQLLDETEKPDATELAGYFRTALEGLTAKPLAPTTASRPASQPSSRPGR
jgi:hypothetical protein